MRKRNTRMLTLRLDLVEDADIIAWLDSLPEGGRSQAVRDVLRGNAHHRATPVESSIKLESIRNIVAEELDRVLSSQRLSQPDEMKQQIEDDDAEKKYGDKLDQMLGGLQAQTQDSDS